MQRATASVSLLLSSVALACGLAACAQPKPKAKPVAETPAVASPPWQRFSAPAEAQQPHLLLTSRADVEIAPTLSADGRLFANAGSDGFVRIFATDSGQLLRTILCPGANSLAFAPDGKLLAAGSESYLVRVFDVQSGAPVVEIRDAGNLVAFSPDGAQLATAFPKGLYVWDYPAGTLRKAIGFGHGATALAFSPHGDRIAVAGARDSISVFEPTTGAAVYRGGAEAQNGGAVALAMPDSDTLLVTSREGLNVVDLKNKKVAATIAELAAARTVAMLAGGKEAVVAVDDKVVVIDARLGSVRRSWAGLPAGLTLRVAVSTDGNTVVLDGATEMSAKKRERLLAVVDPTDGHTLRQLAQSQSGDLRGIALHPQGHIVAVYDYPDGVHFFDLERGGAPQLVKGPDSARFSPDGNSFLGVAQNVWAARWDISNGKLMWMYKGKVEDCDFSPDAKVVACLGSDSVTLLDAETGQLLRSLAKTAASPTWASAFSPDNLTFLTASHARNAAGEWLTRLEVWEVASGTKKHESELPIQRIVGAAWLDGGKSLLAVDASGDLFYLDGTTFAQQRRVEGGGRCAASVALTPDGRIAALGGSICDNHVTLRDAATGAEVGTLTTTNTILRVAITSNGKRLIAASKSGAVQVFDLESKRELAMLVGVGADDWVATTPDGRFDGTPSGMRALAVVQGLEATPLAALFERAFTPRLVAQALSGDKAATGAAAVTIAPVTPAPKVRLTKPADGSATTTAEIEVAVEAEDQGGGIGDIRLLLNGKAVPSAEPVPSAPTAPATTGASADKSVQRTFKLLLAPGSNELTASAYNRDRIESTPVYAQVTYEGGKADASLYVLAVGINQYKDAAQRLSFGSNDAKAFASALQTRAKGVFTSVDTTLLLDAKASRAEIEAAFARIAARARPQDAFIFFFAGHGIVTAAAPGATQAELFLAPAEMQPLYGDGAQPTDKALAASKLRELCTRILAGKQLLVFDTYAAPAPAPADAAAAVPTVSAEPLLARLARAAGVTVLATARNELLASEVETQGFSVVAQALGDGITGKADAGTPPDGKVTLRELVAYAAERVPALLREQTGTATPTTLFVRGQDFPISVAAAEKAPKTPKGK